METRQVVHSQEIVLVEWSKKGQEVTLLRVTVTVLFCSRRNYKRNLFPTIIKIIIIPPPPINSLIEQLIGDRLERIEQDNITKSGQDEIITFCVHRCNVFSTLYICIFGNEAWVAHGEEVADEWWLIGLIIFNIVIMIMKKFTDQFHFSLNVFCTPFMLFFFLIYLTADFIKTCQIYNVSEPEFVKCSTESIQALFDNINKGKLNVKA